MKQLANALVPNTTLCRLDVRGNSNLTAEGIRPFYENPESMNHLRTFWFHESEKNFVDSAKKIMASLKDNMTLGRLSYMEKMDRSERFHLDLNRMGRKYLYQEDDIMILILPHMLARMATSDEIHLMYFFLHERADLL